MGRDKFVQEMGKSRVLVGMGDPVISPTQVFEHSLLLALASSSARRG
jgi:hypothetical protein